MSAEVSDAARDQKAKTTRAREPGDVPGRFLHLDARAGRPAARRPAERARPAEHRRGDRDLGTKRVRQAGELLPVGYSPYVEMRSSAGEVLPELGDLHREPSRERGGG